MHTMRNVITGLKETLFAIGLCFAASGAHSQTGATGGGQPFDNTQPSLAVNSVMPLEGIFPPNGGAGSALGDTLGFVYHFAGNFPPGTSLVPQGQLLSIDSNTALFALIGTTYGGDGISTFALPDLQGGAIISVGTGAGLSTQTLGAATGSPNVTLPTSQVASHNHTASGGSATGLTGGGQSFDNMQPSLPLQRLVAVSGVFPSQGGGSGSAAFLGQVATFAGNFVPSGWLAADGQLLAIITNQALFALLGTTFGGDGMTTFALPDLRGRVSVGADATNPLGTAFGQEFTTLTVAQLPAHDHTMPGGGLTGSTGSGQPVSNEQPSLALNYLIAISGIFPFRDSGAGFDPGTPTLGQITEFAGNFAPSGWAFAHGQLLTIASNTALFSLLGTQYGGNGTTTFALPDLRGRTMIGTGSHAGVSYIPGDTSGSNTTTLTIANLPAHAHTLSGNANLSNLTISAGSLSPLFASGTTSYTDLVLNPVTSVAVTPTLADSGASVKVNGVAVASGNASGAIALAVGSGNVINVVVTAQDGTTTRTYTLTVTRLGPQDITFGMRHSGNFERGSSGAIFSITVSNIGGLPSDGSLVTVTDTLPAGLTATALSGSGWNCVLGTLTCTRTDVLNALSSYPAITLTVSVAGDAGMHLINNAAVSGGGDLNVANNTVNNSVSTVSGLAPILFLLLD